MGRATPTREILLVESDKDARDLTAALFEETDLSVVECASWRVALEHLADGRGEVAMIFGDIDGDEDALDAIAEIQDRWPDVRIVLTGDRRARRPDRLPDHARFMPKPWLALEVLIAAEAAAARR